MNWAEAAYGDWAVGGNAAGAEAVGMLSDWVTGGHRW